MPNRCAAALAASFALLPSAHGQELVRDIHPNVVRSSSPSSFVRVGPQSYFQAAVPVPSGNSARLFRTDGTEAGTTSVAVDLQPLHAVGTTLLCARTTTNPAAQELWRHDTTTGTSTLVRTFTSFAVAATLGTRTLLNVGGSTTEQGLWVTDGTPAGTTRVLPVGVGLGAVVGSRFIYQGSHSSHGREPYASDGTAAGTGLLRDLRPGTFSSDPQAFCSYAGKVYFFARSGTINAEMWETDGTPAGTTLVTTLSDPQTAIVVSDRMYFASYGGPSGYHLMYSDGTNAGTGTVRLFARLPSLQPLQQGVLCSFGPPTNEVWVSDGTSAGTVQVLSGHATSSTSIPAAAGAVFATTDVNATQALHYASASPPMVRTLRVGNDLVDGLVGASLGTSVVLNAQHPDSGRELYVSDLTAAGTRLLADLHPQLNSSPAPRSLTALEDRLVFASSLVGGVWSSDGTPAGTTLATDAPNGNATRLDPGGAVLLDRLFFRGDDGTWGWEVFSTNGLNITRHYVHPTGNSYPANFMQFGEAVYFNASHPTSGNELRVKRPSANSPALHADLVPGPGSSTPRPIGVANGLLFVQATTPLTGRELYATDGTPGQLRLVKDVQVGSAQGVYEVAAPVGNRLFFASPVGTQVSELWVSDGSTAGSTLVRSFTTLVGPDPALSHFVGMNGRLFFVVTTAVGREVWTSDGTALGTTLLRDIAPGPEDGVTGPLVVAGDRLFFAGTDANGTELWMSDGTTAGTTLVHDLPGGGLSPAEITAAGTGRDVLFAGTTPTTGYELWTSDGTSAGTRMLADLAVGAFDSFPAEMTRVGTTVFFVATATGPGRELHKLSLASIRASLAVTFGRGCPGTSAQSPRLAPTGQPRLGNTGFAFDLQDAPPGAAAFVLFGLGGPRQLVGGTCELRVNPLSYQILVANAAGTAVAPFPVPNLSAFLGAELSSQSLVIDPLGAAFGLGTLTNGVLVLVGD